MELGSKCCTLPATLTA